MNKLPTFLTFLRVFSRNYLGNLLPVLVLEVLHELTVLDHEREQAVLEEVRLVVLPLGESSLALRRIVALVQKLLEDVHGVLVRYDTSAIELVLFVAELDDVLASLPLTVGLGFSRRLIALSATLSAIHGAAGL